MEKSNAFFCLTGQILFSEDVVKDCPDYDKDGNRTGTTTPHRVTNVNMVVQGLNGQSRSVIISSRDLANDIKVPTSGNWTTPEIKSYQMNFKGFIEVRI